MGRLLLVALSLLLMVSYAAAADTESEALASFNQAKQFYQSQQYSSAMDAFQKSIALYDAAARGATDDASRKRIGANAALVRRWRNESACLDHAESSDIQQLRDLIGDANSINDARYHNACSEFLKLADYVTQRIAAFEMQSGQTDSHVLENLFSASEAIWSSGIPTLRSVSIGNSLNIYFNAPNAEHNAAAGQLLFEGVERDGNISGTGYSYKDGCRPVPFHFSGTFEKSRRIVLQGNRPTMEGGCDSKATSPVKMELAYLRSSDKGGVPPTTPAPSSDGLGFLGDMFDGLDKLEKSLAAMGINGKCSGKSFYHGLSKDCIPVAEQSVPGQGHISYVPVGLKCKDENEGVFELITLWPNRVLHMERVTFSDGLPISYSDQSYIPEVNPAWDLSLLMDNKIPGNPKPVYIDSPDGSEVSDFKDVTLPGVFDLEMFVCQNQEARRNYEKLLTSNRSKNGVH